MKNILAFLIIAILISCTDSRIDVVDMCVSKVSKKINNELTYEVRFNKPTSAIEIFYEGKFYNHTAGRIAYLCFLELENKGLIFTTYGVWDKQQINQGLYSSYDFKIIKEKNNIAQQFIESIKLSKYEVAIQLVDNLPMSDLKKFSSLIHDMDISIEFKGLVIRNIQNAPYAEVVYKMGDTDVFWVSYNLNKKKNSIVGFGLNPDKARW